MDKTIRRNERCIIGLPRCDFVFSSTRSCFIAYGFNESTLEMTILRNVLREESIEPVEAGGNLAPGQSAFCAKICSKIITAQFCAVLLNNEEDAGREIPNANVNMEYGLMLGFNKYVIPFQRASQRLPFNVAGLDTIKYTDRDFERLAREAIRLAVRETQQESQQIVPLNQEIDAFVLANGMLVTIVSQGGGDRDLFMLGNPLGFNLLNDFAGTSYLGNFTALRPEIILWRVRNLDNILTARAESVPLRVQIGAVREEQAAVIRNTLESSGFWILVNSDEDKTNVLAGLENLPLTRSIDVFSRAEVTDILRQTPQMT